MDKKLSKYITLIILFLLFSPKLPAQLSLLETETQRLIYFSDIQSYLAPYVARCFENSFQFHREFFNYSSTEKITVFLHDFNDFGNAGADVVPRNQIVIGIAPYRYVFETSPANERMNSTMNHELVHIVAMDKATKGDEFYRSLFFGKVVVIKDNPISMLYSFLTTPRRYSPRWYHEGIAVFLETWMAGGIGRAIGAYDEMVFRTMVRDSSYFYDIVGLESEGTQIDFQVGVNSYLYGTRFMSYLAYLYGLENLINWVSRTEDSKKYFAGQFENVYGITLERAWEDWIIWEHNFQQPNLNSIHKNPITKYRVISETALGSVSRAFYDSIRGKIYAAVRYPGQIAHIAAIDVKTGKLDKICDIKGAGLYYVTSLTYDPTANTIFYTTDNNSWRDLYSVNITTGESILLIKEVRTGDLTFNPIDKSIWGVRHYNGISTLVRIPHPYNEWNQVYSYPYGKDIYDIDISPDGKIVTSALIDISGNQKLIKMNTDSLLLGDTSYEVLFDFENSSPANFVYSSDGKYLFGSSYYSGVSNIYRYNVEKNDMSIISNCETGFFRPLPFSKDSLIVFRYTGKGFIPVVIADEPVEKVSAITFLGNEIVKKYPIVKDWMAGSPASINLDSTSTYSGEYDALKNMKLVSAYPVVEGYKDFAAFGMRFNFAGPVGLHDFNLTTSYSPNDLLKDEEKIHANIKYSYMEWNVFATYNNADFYDLAGPTKTSRKGYSIGFEYDKSLIFDKPRIMDYSVNVTGYGDLQTLPEFQNVGAPFDKLLSVNGKFNYQFLQKSLGAVDDEKGFKWQLISSNNYVHSKLYPRIYNNFDYGIPLVLNHSSFWLRNSLGYSFGERTDPFANFYFGGFGNNWVDHLPEKRYREYYSFPGIELNDVGGTNFAKILFEWTLPPVRFRRLGWSSFYVSWSRFVLFSSGISTNLDSDIYKRSLLNLGGQIDFRIVFLSHLKATLSFGYAQALEKDKKASDEFMISLKVL